ncbi:hypothetical protein C8R43DRAFT_514232 [Mycena crocata]|nr:hypothetical protein C8R43DRAFT_514232 [Mycena crocata]
MQVTTLFATFFAFFTLIAPLAAALQITVPTNITTGNATLICTSDAVDPPRLLTFFIVKNTTAIAIARGVDPTAATVAVTIPANISGNWSIQAWTADNKVQAGESRLFSLAPAPPPKSGMSMAGSVVGGVVGGVIGVAFAVFGVFFYIRRRRQQAASPVFNLENGFPTPKLERHERSFSSTSSGLADTADNKLEMEKMQWEMELEEQFARARAGTPDVARGISPAPVPHSALPPRGISPLRGPLMPLVPQRAATRKTNY